MSVFDVIWHGLRDSFLMAWEVWWALVLGFAISAIVQAWVPRERIEGLMSGSDARSIGWATGLGAASSSCSYAAIAIAKSLFQKGASAASALAFQLASTNLVWELGLVLWVLIGWQFTLAEYVGGIVMIVLMTALLRRFVSRELEEQAREHAREADTGHQHHMAGEQLSWRERLTSVRAWSDVAHNFRGDWQMLWKEITIGFLLAGFVAQFGNGFFNSLFLKGSPALVQTVWGAFIGPVIAVLSFVCSVGNVPLAAVLWSGGISFAGVLAFLFADLIVLPILAIYRKYYGTTFTVRITALMFTTMVTAALIVDAIFSALGLIPTGPRPTRADIFSSIHVDYKLALNVLGVVIFSVLFWLTARRGATDPVCGMKVDRDKAIIKELGGETFYFCSTHCLHAFEADLDNYQRGNAPAVGDHSQTPTTEPNPKACSVTERAEELHVTADRQVVELTGLITTLDEPTLRLPCPGREKLGDGTTGAFARHMADNYRRLAAFVQTTDGISEGHAPNQHDSHRSPRFLRAFAHEPADHREHGPGAGPYDNEYTADNIDPAAVIAQLSASRDALGRIAVLTDHQLDAIPPKGSFRFCDGQRTLEQVIASVLKHQSHQLDALKAATRSAPGAG